jgi:SAM-dependent methyltransferase
MENLYRPSAHLYDLDPRDITRDDISFYRQKAKKISGPVLDLGCGTGRVAIQLAEEAREVWGLDLSEDMLAQFSKKLAVLPISLTTRLKILHGSMANFNLGRKFDLIIAPFRAFQALTDRADQRSALSCIKAHLSDRGQFIMHVFRPKTVFDEDWVQPETFDWEVIDPTSNKCVRRYQKRKRIDVSRQILYVDLIYRIDGCEQEITEPLALSYFYEDQMRKMLQENDFQIQDEMGYFDGRLITYGPELIYVCQ